MIKINLYQVLVQESIDILEIVFLAGFLAKIKNISYYLTFLVLVIPLCFVANFSAILISAVLLLLFLLLRYTSWKKNNMLITPELISFFFALTINIFVSFTSCMLTEMLLRSFNIVRFSNNWLFIVTQEIINLILAIVLFFCVTRIYYWIKTKSVEKPFLCQLAFLDIFLLMVVEFSRAFDVLGIIKYFFLSFMLIQLALSLYMTYSQLKAQRQKQESKNLSQQIHVMSLYTDELEANYQQLRKFKHDYNNLLLGLNLEDGQINKKYLQQVNKYSSEDLSKGYSIFKDLGNLKLKAVKSLILTKLIEARKAKIDVYFDARHPINDVNLEEIILVRMLGILLDNAIEAISEAQEKKLIIAMKEYDNTLKVVIENSFNGKEINPDKIRKYGYTTKKGSHGLGLANIMDIIKEHPNVHLKQEVVDKHFISTLEIN